MVRWQPERDNPPTNMEETTPENNKRVYWWCFLIVNGEVKTKINTFIHHSDAHPAEELERHNAGRIKSTRGAAGHWKLQMNVGPFPDEELAEGFSHLWKKGRGIAGRIKRGCELSEKYDLTCFCLPIVVTKQSVI